jgi:CubicO group peptidase (beta-lactamase class C family)
VPISASTPTTAGWPAGWLVLVSRGGKIAHLETYGQRDETGAPIEVDTLFRMYSMTKPVTAVAAMICYEEGLFDLSDPVSELIPSFAGSRVLTGGCSKRRRPSPATSRCGSGIC